MPANAKQRDRYWEAASYHLAWCREHDVDVIDGRWDPEDPISGLLLAAVLARSSARPVLNTLCRRSWDRVRVTAAWWPSSLVDLVVNFVADEVRYMLLLENKHLTTNSNQPGYKKLLSEGRRHEILWQTEKTLGEVDRVRARGGERLLGGPFDPEAVVLPVLLDAASRTMDEAFPVYEWMTLPHRHDRWSAVSYAELAEGLRDHYERDLDPLLEPLLAQLFACAGT